jgi:hypothetical protein
LDFRWRHAVEIRSRRDRYDADFRIRRGKRQRGVFTPLPFGRRVIADHKGNFRHERPPQGGAGVFIDCNAALAGVTFKARLILSFQEVTNTFLPNRS